MKIRHRLLSAAIAAASFAALSGAAQAGQAPVIVLGTNGIWLAGQATGSSVSGYFGADTAPANSPKEVIPTAAVMTFTATGSTSVDDSCFAGAAGGCYSDQSSFSPSPWSGDYNGPADALVGIFLGASAPALSNSSGFVGPSLVAGPDYQNPANVGPGTYSPALDQIFLIGDGSGETFNTPAGATQLYLGVADSLGASKGNAGYLLVNFTGGMEVPEPSTWAMMLVGFGGLGAAMRSRRKLAAIAA